MQPGLCAPTCDNLIDTLSPFSGEPNAAANERGPRGDEGECISREEVVGGTRAWVIRGGEEADAGVLCMLANPGWLPLSTSGTSAQR